MIRKAEPRLFAAQARPAVQFARPAVQFTRRASTSATLLLGRSKLAMELEEIATPVDPEVRAYVYSLVSAVSTFYDWGAIHA